MLWLFGQVWVLCVVSFVLGALVTWLLFAGPARRRHAVRRAASGRAPGLSPVLARWAETPPAPPPVPPPPAGPAVDRALAALDSRGERPGPRLGTAATGALDLLGVPGAPPPDRASRPTIPAQGGPAASVGPARPAEEGEPPRAR